MRAGGGCTVVFHRRSWPSGRHRHRRCERWRSAIETEQGRGDGCYSHASWVTAAMANSFLMLVQAITRVRGIAKAAATRRSAYGLADHAGASVMAIRAGGREGVIATIPATVSERDLLALLGIARTTAATTREPGCHWPYCSS